MSTCCAAESQSVVGSPGGCPRCGSRGVRVDPITLKALLVPQALRRGIPAAPRFCATRECSIVYFDSSAGVTFSESEVSVPVYAKRPDELDVPVCYCFGITRRTIHEEASREHTHSVSQRIRDEVTAGHCACEVRNPKGACCLGDIIAAEKMASS